MKNGLYVEMISWNQCLAYRVGPFVEWACWVRLIMSGYKDLESMTSWYVSMRKGV